MHGAIGGDFTEYLCRAGAVQSGTPSRRGVEVNRGLLDVLTDNGTVTGGAEETGHLTACPWEEPVRHCAGLEHRERCQSMSTRGGKFHRRNSTAPSGLDHPPCARWCRRAAYPPVVLRAAMLCSCACALSRRIRRAPIVWPRHPSQWIAPRQQPAYPARASSEGAGRGKGGFLRRGTGRS